MSRRYQPDGTLLLTAVAGRIDALEHANAQTTADVAAIGRGLGDLTGQIRRIITHHHRGRGWGGSADRLGDRRPLRHRSRNGGR